MPLRLPNRPVTGDAAGTRPPDGKEAPPGTRLPLYPWSLLFFLAAAAYVVLGAVVSNPANALRGAVLVGAGVPVYSYWRRRAR